MTAASCAPQQQAAERAPAQQPDWASYGRKGGQVTRDKHGKEHFVRAGRKGGQRTVAHWGRGHMGWIGRLGGRVTSERRWGT